MLWTTTEILYLRRPELVMIWKITSIFFYFFICNIHGVYLWKNTYMYLNVILVKISILIYASNLEFFVWNRQGKTLLFAINFDSKKRKCEILKKFINDFCIGIVFILIRKKWGGGGGHRWKNEEGLSQTLQMCLMRGGYSKMLPCSLNQS